MRKNFCAAGAVCALARSDGWRLPSIAQGLLPRSFNCKAIVLSSLFTEGLILAL